MIFSITKLFDLTLILTKINRNTVNRYLLEIRKTIPYYSKDIRVIRKARIEVD